MPVFSSIQRNNLSVAVWEITEDPVLLKDFLQLQMVMDVHSNPTRTAQWLACRVALQTILPSAEVQVFKDEFGKPFVDGDLHISLSHTNRFAAAITADVEVGVDIEEITPRIKRIAQRFLHPEEMKLVQNLENLRMLYLIWCAKEAMFKLYGKKSVDFAEDIRVIPFDLDEEGTFEIQFKAQPMLYRAEYQIFENHVLVWVTP